MYSAVFGVIASARGRQRRRHRSTAAVVALCAGIGAGLIVSRADNPAPPATIAGAASVVAPGAVLAQQPFMGVACRWGGCDAVGLAVWLRRPALSVSATIAGHRLTLTNTSAYPRPGARATFVGYLRAYRRITHLHLSVGPGPTTWDTPGAWPSPAVVLRIDYGNGLIRVARLRALPLEPGWG